MEPKEDWLWAGWGLSGVVVGVGFALFVTIPLMAAGGPSYKELGLLAIILGGAVVGWRVAVRIGYRRNFPG